MNALEKYAAISQKKLLEAAQRWVDRGMTADGLAKAAGIPAETFTEGFHAALPKAVANAGVSAGLGAGMVGASILAQHAHAREHEKKKGAQFEAMLLENKDLLNHPDPEMVVKRFASLHKIAPEIAEDPLMAGDIMRSTLRYGGEGWSVDHMTALARLQREHEQSNSSMAKVDPLKRLAIFNSLPGAS